MFVDWRWFFFCEDASIFSFSPKDNFIKSFLWSKYIRGWGIPTKTLKVEPPWIIMIPQYDFIYLIITGRFLFHNYTTFIQKIFLRLKKTNKFFGENFLQKVFLDKNDKQFYNFSIDLSFYYTLFLNNIFNIW